MKLDKHVELSFESSPTQFAKWYSRIKSSELNGKKYIRQDVQRWIKQDAEIHDDTVLIPVKKY